MASRHGAGGGSSREPGPGLGGARRRRRRRRWLLLSVAAPLLLLAASPARAGETYAQSFHIGERAAGLAGAYTALAEEATGAYYNPAGMVDVAGGSALGLTVSAYQVDLRSLGDQLSVGSEHRGLVTRSFTSFPSAFGYVRTFGDKLRQALGVLILVPDSDVIAGQVSLRVPSLPDPNGGPPLLNLAASESFRRRDQTYWFGLGYAIRLHRRISLGATLYYLLRHFQGFRSLLIQGEQGGSFGGLTNVASTEVLHGSLRLDVGLKVRASERLTFGLAVRSPNLRIHRGGDFFLDTGDPGGPATPALAELEVESNEPFQVAFGVAWEVPKRWTLSFDLRFQGAVSPYDALTYKLPGGNPEPLPIFGARLERDPLINASIGTEVYLSEHFVLRGGFYTDFSSRPEQELTADRVGADRIHLWGLTLGFGFVGARTRFGLSFNYAFGLGSVVGQQGTLTANPVVVSADANRQYLTILVGGAYSL